MPIFPTDKKESWQSKKTRWMLNFFPAYRLCGGRCIFLSADSMEIHIKLKLTLWTRNYVGTIFGGSMFSATDPIYMVQLINILGKNYVVWDKSASIRFRKPADQTLYARFLITESLLESIKAQVAEQGEMELDMDIELVDKTQTNVYAQLQKKIYIADKAFFKEKKKQRKVKV